MPRTAYSPGLERAHPKLLKQLEGLRWSEHSYRVLSYPFSIRCNSRGVTQYLQRVLGVFATPPEPLLDQFPEFMLRPPRYTVATIGRGASAPHHVLRDDDLMATGMTRAAALGRLLTAINAAALMYTGDFFILHSGSVVAPNGLAVLLPAQSGSGKTTLTLGLVMGGFGYLSDEGAVIDPVTYRVFPYPKALGVKDGSIEMFAELRNGNGSSASVDEWRIPPSDIRHGALAAPSPIGYVFFPKFEQGAKTEVTPMTRAEAALGLVQNATNLRLYRGRALAIAAEVVKRAPAFRLAVGDLGDAIRKIQKITGAGSGN